MQSRACATAETVCSRATTVRANSASPCARKKSQPASARIPSAACGLATTARAIAIASSTLFCTPRAMRSGATTHAAWARYGLTSGTPPVTTTPGWRVSTRTASAGRTRCRSEEHTSELQSPKDLVCRLLLEKKKQEMDTAGEKKKETSARKRDDI